MVADKKQLKKVCVSSEIYRGLSALCTSKVFKSIMFETETVVAWLRANDFTPSSSWVERNKDDYLQGVFAGFRPRK